MRTRTLFATILAVTISVAAQAKDKNVLPVNPFAKAASGDWASYCTKTTKINGRQHLAHRYAESIEVRGVAREQVTIAQAGGSKTYPAKGPITLEDLLGKRDALVDIEKAEEVTRTINGHDFPCRKITFTMGSSRACIWISPQVKGCGIVLFVCESNDGGRRVQVERVVTGFGAEGKVEWGKTEQDVQRSLDAKAP
jgi:hypothetical protein